MAEKKGNEMALLCVVLFLITLVSATLLGFVNSVTAPQIELNKEKTRAAAMSMLIPDSEFELVEKEVVSDTGAPTLKNIYRAVQNGETVGYCMEALPSGFGGELTVVVGILADGTIAGAQVTSMAETPGLGAKSQSEWIDQYAGMPADGSLAVTKDGGSVVPITGATITSRAVTLGVNTAASYAATLE